MNVVDEVQAIVARVRATPLDHVPANEDERYQQQDSQRVLAAVRALPGVDNSRPMPQRFREFTIAVGLGDAGRVEAAMLHRLRPLDLAAAPEVAALIPFADGQVLITRYWACAGERIIPFGDGVAIARAAAARFRRDLGVLADEGLMHPMAGRTSGWSFGETSGTIVLGGWAGVRAIRDTDERDETFRFVDAMLAQCEAAS